MNNLLTITEKKKIKKIINEKFYKENYLNKKNIYIKIKKIIIFCKNNLFFISYNYLFFFLKNFNINYLNRIIYLIKKFNIKIYNVIPKKEKYYIDLKLNNIFKKKEEVIKKYNNNICFKNFFKKNNNLKEKNIINIYKIIEKNLKNIKKILINNFILFKIISLRIKFIKNYKRIFKNYKISKNKKYNKNYKKILKSILFKKKYKTKKYFNKILKKKSIKLNKIFFKFIFFLKNIYINNKKNKIYENFFKKFNFEKKKIIFNSELLDETYNILYIYIKKINYIKKKIYDILINISKISLLKFTFYFNKNGTNLSWIFDFSDLSQFDENFNKNYKKFIYSQENKLKKIEKKVSIPLKFFIKLFDFIELNKFKIDIIKNNLLEDNLHLVNYVTIKYFKKELYWDYIQEGVIGLIYSINKFKYKYKNFFNFTIFNIKSNINKFYYKSSKLINLPRTLISSIKKINEVVNIFFKKYNEKPTIKYLEKKTNLSKKNIIKSLKVFKEPLSLEAKINTNDSDETRYIDIVEDKDQINNEDFIFDIQIKKIINNILKNFSGKFKKILSMIYGINNFKKHSYIEISRKYNIPKKDILNVNNFFLKKINDNNLIENIEKFIK